MKLAELNVATLVGLLVCTLSAYGQQGLNNVEQRVNTILNQMAVLQVCSRGENLRR